jgi:ArsR family transcriptional regulator
LNKNREPVCAVTIVDQEKIRRVSADLPDEKVITELAETFKVLGDPTRLRIILALLIEELCVCDLSELIGLSQSAISHQLRVLRNLKLVKFQKRGKMVYYSLDDEHIQNLIREAKDHVRE